MRARAPGRVNLIGDHTDYTGGLALPMAVDRHTVVDLTPGGAVVELWSDVEAEPAVVPVAIASAAGTAVGPPWARYVAGVVAVVRPATGGRGTVTTTLPVGAGLASSAALEVAVALALGFEGPPLALARACQRAEHRATGVPTGLMDQLASAAGIEGHALLLDFQSYEVTPVPLPDGVDVLVVHSGQSRTLVGRPTPGAEPTARRRRPSSDPSARRSQPTSNGWPTTASAGGPGTWSPRTGGCSPSPTPSAPATYGPRAR
jgi:galactokinase